MVILQNCSSFSFIFSAPFIMVVVEQNFSLKRFHTFGMDVKAAFFAPFLNTVELQFLLEQAKASSVKDTLILGGGSNVLFHQDLSCWVLRNEIPGIEVYEENNTEVFLEVGAGVVWHDFVQYCVQKGWGGVENLSLIPGSVGAAPMQNIGAYGVELKDVFVSLEAMHQESFKLVQFDHADCRFGYRESVFKRALKNQFVITKVRFRLQKEPRLQLAYGAISSELKKMDIVHPSIADVSAAVMAIRRSKLPDPKLVGNAGSFFKNPVVSAELAQKILSQYPEAPNYPEANSDKVKLAAGWLIEKCGWKGVKSGEVGCHPLQALVLVNYGGGTGQEILALANNIMDDVHEKFQIQLEPEVNIYP